MALYNFLAAFVICGAVVVMGDLISQWTKAWIPSVFASACILLVGYWTIIPPTLVKDSFLIPFGSTVCIYLLITHMGTIISLKHLMEQWKTVVTCLMGLVGMCGVAYVCAPWFMDRALVIAGLPPLTGGIVAATMMQAAAMKAGLTVAAVFAISMYCIQGFAGYPITAVCLKKEGVRLLAEFRKGGQSVSEAEMEAVRKVTELPQNNRKGPLALPAKYSTPFVILLKLGIVSYCALMLGMWTGVSGAIWALILGVVFCTLGFLESDALHRANSYGIMIFALMMFIFDGLKDCTPQMLAGIVMPMIVLIVLGLIGMFVMAVIAAKILKLSPYMAFANCLTALYGFPFDAVITESTCDALAKTPEEKDYLMGKMFPSMIVGGFVTVTITSVFIAGIFSKML